ncbi:hypothetical protein AAGW05_16010, partial [Arthrobacter sp. LAPM80]|uniref:hypothetical protein n=1 Tax=Arthrobacter sp. LAPM80 TaxID=3141788 RepID=UPI00398BA12A
ILPAPQFPVFRSQIGASANEVRELQRTLDFFCPSSYGDFFHQMRAALQVDAKIQRSMSPKDAREEHWTPTTHSKFINDICNYSYGIFAYADVGSRLGAKARKTLPQTQTSLTTSLHKFRPMHKGLLTDTSRRQFILWRVGEGIPDLLVIKWDALSRWLDGMESGHYVGLRARHIRVVNNLNSEDQDVVKLMVTMADNLRSGTRRTTPRPRDASPKGRTQLVGHRTTAPLALGYKPESEWLVPITVSGRNVSTGFAPSTGENRGPH